MDKKKKWIIKCKYCHKSINKNDKEYMFLKDKNIETKIKYSFKNKTFLEDSIKMSEELRFIGESVLNKYITETLLKINKHDFKIKTLEKIRNKLIYNKHIFKDIEDDIGKENIIVYVIGAIYYDGGTPSVNEFLDNILMEKIIKKFEDLNLINNPKNNFQESISKIYKVFPFYQITKHGDIFIVDIKINDVIFCSGEGKNKKDSELDAINKGMKKLETISNGETV